jgi:hypothetical protein
VAITKEKKKQNTKPSVCYFFTSLLKIKERKITSFLSFRRENCSAISKAV